MNKFPSMFCWGLRDNVIMVLYTSFDVRMWMWMWVLVPFSHINE